MEEQGGSFDKAGLVNWEPSRQLRRVDEAEVRLSRGFLRCRPERWFPGFASHWLTLAHSIGVELDVLEVKPFASVPRGFDSSFVGTVDDEPICLAIEEESLRELVNVIIPGAVPSADGVLAEYLARRLLTSLSLSWSGPESSVVRFDSEMQSEDSRFAGGVKFTFSLNGNACVVWLSLGKLMVDRLDGLWRRQVQSTGKRFDEDSSEVSLEIAQLAVPPSMLSDYTRSGTVIDLEVPLSDEVLLYRGDNAWSKARLCLVGESFGFEMLTDPIPKLALPEGTTRLSIVLGRAPLDSGAFAELSQVGALFDTQISLSSKVEMLIGGEPVGEGVLCSFEGRFAVSVNRA